ncbi:MAG: M28 family peptidase [Bacteroidota bacterium]
MTDLIYEIIARFGPRPSGSASERKAQEFMAGRFIAFCDEVRKHEFTVPVKAKFTNSKIFCVLHLLALILFPFDIRLALFFSGVNLMLVMAVFMGNRRWLDFLYKKSPSTNITGIIEPLNEAKSTLILSAHIDSAYEFTWWYYLKGIGGKITVATGILFIIFPLFALSYWVLDIEIVKGSYAWETWLVFVILYPLSITWFFMRGRRPVDGAIDNLSGVALIDELGRLFSDKGTLGRLRHTRLKIILFGSEEAGILGSKEYIAAFFRELKEEKASAVNIDTIKNQEELRIVTAEPFNSGLFDMKLIEETENAFRNCGIGYRKCKLWIGVTDASSFTSGGIPAVSIISIPTGKNDPSYHTRLDTIEHLDPKGMQAVRDVMIRFILDHDLSNWK